VPHRFLWRHLQGVAGQDGGFRTQVGGSIGDDGAITIGEPPIRDDKPITLLSESALGLSHVDGEIDDIAG